MNLRIVMCAAALLATSSAWAVTYSVPNTAETAPTLTDTQIHANFSALVNAVNSLQKQVDTLRTALTNVQNKAASQQTTINTLLDQISAQQTINTAHDATLKNLKTRTSKLNNISLTTQGDTIGVYVLSAVGHESGKGPMTATGKLMLNGFGESYLSFTRIRDLAVGTSDAGQTWETGDQQTGGAGTGAERTQKTETAIWTGKWTTDGRQVTITDDEDGSQLILSPVAGTSAFVAVMHTNDENYNDSMLMMFTKSPATVCCIP